MGKYNLTATDPTVRTSFAARLNTNGKVIWMTELPPTFVVDVAGTRTGGAYVLTAYQAFEGIPSLGSNYRDIFAVRALGKRGEPLWTFEVPGVYVGLADTVGADRAGNCFIQGSFAGRIDVGTRPLSYQLGRTAYVIGLTADGQPSFGWMLNKFSFGEHFAVDRLGNWYVGTTFISLDSVSGYDGLVAKNGDDSAVEFGGSRNDYVQKIAVGTRKDRSVYVAGQCYSVPAWVGSNALTNVGAFIGKFNL
jgi:hypothetical protein